MSRGCLFYNAFLNLKKWLTWHKVSWTIETSSRVSSLTTKTKSGTKARSPRSRINSQIVSWSHSQSRSSRLTRSFRTVRISTRMPSSTSSAHCANAPKWSWETMPSSGSSPFRLSSKSLIWIWAGFASFGASSGTWWVSTSCGLVATKTCTWPSLRSTR